MSMMAIWAMTAQNADMPPFTGVLTSSPWPGFLGLDFEEYLVGSLVEQKEAAPQQDEIAPADVLAEDGKENCRQAHHPGQGEEQGDPGRHGKDQPQPAGLVLLRRGNPGHEDADENDVVDTQDDFKGSQHQEGHPHARVEDGLHGFWLLSLTIGGCGAQNLMPLHLFKDLLDQRLLGP